MNSMCDHELATRYVAGTLDDGEVESFEQHVLACEVCQANVREAAAVRSALLTRHRRMRYVALGAPVALAAAAVLAWIMLAPSQLQRLGRIGELPGLQPMQVRAAEDSAAVYADRGITAYQQHDFRAAVTWLQRAEALKPQPGVEFFVGASQLMLRRPDSALAAFRHVIESGDPAYLPEARYYAGKAWLQLGKADSALAQLQASSTSSAQALADSVKRMR